MSLRSGARVAVLVVASALLVALDAGASTDAGSRSTRLSVGSEAQFDAAARALRRSGGTIVLRPRLYRQLVIGWRSGKPLRIVGTRGTRIESVIFDRAYRVSLGHVTIGPIRGDALVDVRASRHVVLHDLVVTARGTRFRRACASRTRATSRSGGAPSHTAVDRSWRPAACSCGAGRALLSPKTTGSTIAAGATSCTAGSAATSRSAETASNGRFRAGDERPPPGHQDLVQLFAGQRLVERNRFGIQGGRGPAVPDERGRSRDDREQHLRRHRPATAWPSRAHGHHRQRRVEAPAALRQDREQHDPHGARRRDGYAGSIRMS